MKLDCAKVRQSYRNNKQKRRWYKKVRWHYERNGNCHGNNKFGGMSVQAVLDGWQWVAEARDWDSWRRKIKTGLAKSRQLAQKRALDAVRGLVGL